MYVIDQDGEVRRDTRQTVTWLVLIAVGILFGMLFVVTFAVTGNEPVTIPSTANLIFWVSTISLLIISGLMVSHTRMPGSERQQQVVLSTAFLLGMAFTTLQAFGFISLWDVIEANKASGQPTPGLVQVFFVMVALHAAHVLGGLVLLYKAMIKSFDQRYNAHTHKGMRLLEPYWHLLTVIWILFFILL